MKRIGLVFSTVILFAISLYVAYQQGTSYAEVTSNLGGHMAAPLDAAAISMVGMKASFLGLFAKFLNVLSSAFGGSIVAALIVLALLVELITLYPAVNLQLKSKKIHLFHKKLVDRFRRGDLTMSETKHELDVLYSVNERMHARGAVLVAFQLLAFVLVLWGLELTALNPSVLNGTFSSFNFALLARPVDLYLPMIAALAYMLHALIKINVKQREDYISLNQSVMALGFAFFASAVVYYFASTYATLLSVYFLTQLTFATMRFIVVEDNAKVWGKQAQKDLIKLLRSSKLHKTKLEKWSRKFNHLPIIRNLNFHLMEESLSMSLALVIAINGVGLI